MSGQPGASGPDLAQGIAIDEIPDGKMVQGHVGDAPVVVARRGDELFAIDAHCSHYGGPLADGILVGDTVRCPWHHACFSLTDGEALRPPALSSLSCWNVEKRGDRAVVTGKGAPVAPRSPKGRIPERVVILGAGAAGNAAAEMLRREGYAGPITMIGTELPCDRPNLSKDYLAGTAPEEYVTLRPPEFCVEQKIDVVGGVRATAIEVAQKRVLTDDGAAHPYDALLIATGATPMRPPIPGVDQPHVFTLRTFADSKAIIARAASAKRAVVMGASFIGLEVAASLRTRNVAVDVVATDSIPLGKILGPEVGRFVRGLHEARGVRFHLGQSAQSIDATSVTLTDSTRLEADLVVLGTGVRPAVALAEKAGLAVEHGVLVDEFLAASWPGIFAAGDVARYPDPNGDGRLRIEHWVVAERQGQTAARNLLGAREPFRAVPFFWSAHYDVTISYVGHAERWDRLTITGSLAELNCRIDYHAGRRRLATATIGRDRESLEAEAAMEKALDGEM
jgi:NADPH-dependent 2,4-dienoyl-CoA reductase/sulfur reductase-like enzyme/nitrite reductase/ring-hydroxylating ferredoxin subunit